MPVAPTPEQQEAYAKANPEEAKRYNRYSQPGPAPKPSNTDGDQESALAHLPYGATTYEEYLAAAKQDVAGNPAYQLSPEGWEQQYGRFIRPGYDPEQALAEKQAKEEAISAAAERQSALKHLPFGAKNYEGYLQKANEYSGALGMSGDYTLAPEDWEQQYGRFIQKPSQISGSVSVDLPPSPDKLPDAGGGPEASLATGPANIEGIKPSLATGPANYDIPKPKPQAISHPRAQVLRLAADLVDQMERGRTPGRPRTPGTPRQPAQPAQPSQPSEYGSIGADDHTL